MFLYSNTLVREQSPASSEWLSILEPAAMRHLMALSSALVQGAWVSLYLTHRAVCFCSNRSLELCNFTVKKCPEFQRMLKLRVSNTSTYGTNWEDIYNIDENDPFTLHHSFTLTTRQWRQRYLCARCPECLVGVDSLTPGRVRIQKVCHKHGLDYGANGQCRLWR